MMRPPLRYLCPRLSMLYLGMTLILSPRVCLTLSQKVAMSSLFLIILREAGGKTGITTRTLLTASTLNTIPLTHTSLPKVVSRLQYIRLTLFLTCVGCVSSPPHRCSEDSREKLQG